MRLRDVVTLLLLAACAEPAGRGGGSPVHRTACNDF